ncbi:MAG: hypothetical protein J5I90_08995 [Caldilineales bacterium]|nr:hypothetical protein [Caldilineales bacterium]
MTNEIQKPNRKGASGLAFVGCLLIGLAVGLLTGQVAAALLGALGIGFIVMAIMRAITGEW